MTNKQGKHQQKQEWRTRTIGSKSQVGAHYILEPHGDKRKLPKGITVVTPPIARELRLAKVSVSKLPITVYTDKKDIDRVKYFEDLIQRGIVPPPAEIHVRPDGSIEVLDGKHRIAAYSNLGYKRIPVVTNATIGEIAEALGNDYEDFEFSKPRTFSEKRSLAKQAIEAQRGNPLVEENTGGAFDSLNPLSSGDTQTDEIIAARKRKLLRSGDLVAGKKSNTGDWKTRTSGTDSQIGQHFAIEPHGDKNALPKDLEIAKAAPIKFAGELAATQKSAFDVQYVDEDIRDNKGNKYAMMNYYQAKELGLYFPYSEKTILISKSLPKDVQERFLEMQVREIAKMKSGMTYLEAHAKVLTEMPEMPKELKRIGFWDAMKGLAVTAMEAETSRQKKQTMKMKEEEAQKHKGEMFSPDQDVDIDKMINKTFMGGGIEVNDKAIENAKEYAKELTPIVESHKKKE